MSTPAEIDRMAQNTFRDTLPPSWLIRKQDPDIHIDYFVEIGNQSKPSGSVFGVQLKGTESARYSESVIKVRLKTQHIAYYMDKVKQPVFIVAVDVTKKQGYWTFIQEWVKQDLDRGKWRNQKTVDVKISLDNRLDNTRRLYNAVLKAELYMRDLWPSSIPAAIEHQRRGLEQLDPRCRVDVSYQDGKSICHVHPKEDLKLNIKFRAGDGVQKKFRDLLDRGLTATFDVSQIVETDGSPLLDKVFNDLRNGKLVITDCREIGACLTVLAVDRQGEETPLLYGLPGKITGGRREVRLEASIRENLLRLNLKLPIPLPTVMQPVKMDFNFDSSAWEGCPILQLPFLDKLATFFKSMEDGYPIKIVCEVDGNHVFSVTSSPEVKVQGFHTIVGYLTTIQRARAVAQAAGINCRFPKSGCISKDDFETISLLHRLITTGEYRQSGHGCRFRGELIPNKCFFEKIDELKKPDAPVIFTPQDEKHRLFGEEFTFGRLRFSLTRPRLVTDVSKAVAEKERIKKSGIELEWVGRKDSELIISRTEM